SPARVASVTSVVASSTADTSAGSTGGGSGSSSSSTGSGANLPGWNLIWSDEFNAPDGSPVDGSKWSFQIGGGGFGNKEREYYTDDVKNAHQEGGHLVITATRDGADSHDCWYGQCWFTSARMATAGHFEHQYGRYEARIKIPYGQGLWPAFWMLGTNIGDPNVGWPQCGEIDIMENVGNDPYNAHGSMHGPGYSGGNPLTGTYALPN